MAPGGGFSRFARKKSTNAAPSGDGPNNAVVVAPEAVAPSINSAEAACAAFPSFDDNRPASSGFSEFASGEIFGDGVGRNFFNALGDDEEPSAFSMGNTKFGMEANDSTALVERNGTHEEMIPAVPSSCETMIPVTSHRDSAALSSGNLPKLAAGTQMTAGAGSGIALFARKCSTTQQPRQRNEMNTGSIPYQSNIQSCNVSNPRKELHTNKSVESVVESTLARTDASKGTLQTSAFVHSDGKHNWNNKQRHCLGDLDKEDTSSKVEGDIMDIASDLLVQRKPDQGETIDEQPNLTSTARFPRSLEVTTNIDTNSVTRTDSDRSNGTIRRVTTSKLQDNSTPSSITICPGSPGCIENNPPKLLVGAARTTPTSKSQARLALSDTAAVDSIILPQATSNNANIARNSDLSIGSASKPQEEPALSDRCTFPRTACRVTSIARDSDLSTRDARVVLISKDQVRPTLANTASSDNLTLPQTTCNSANSARNADLSTRSVSNARAHPAVSGTAAFLGTASMVANVGISPPSKDQRRPTPFNTAVSKNLTLPQTKCNNANSAHYSDLSSKSASKVQEHPALFGTSTFPDTASMAVNGARDADVSTRDVQGALTLKGMAHRAPSAPSIIPGTTSKSVRNGRPSNFFAGTTSKAREVNDPNVCIPSQVVLLKNGVTMSPAKTITQSCASSMHVQRNEETAPTQPASVTPLPNRVARPGSDGNQIRANERTHTVQPFSKGVPSEKFAPITLDSNHTVTPEQRSNVESNGQYNSHFPDDSTSKDSTVAQGVDIAPPNNWNHDKLIKPVVTSNVPPPLSIFSDHSKSAEADKNFDDVYMDFLGDLCDATDLLEKGEADLLELEVELSHAYSLGLHHLGDMMDLLEDIDDVCVITDTAIAACDSASEPSLS